jgi:hypothetical protein
MGMFSLTMSEEQCEQFRQQLAGAVRDHINGEELIAAGAFRRGGAAGSYAASKAGGGLVYAALSLSRKKKAGGLPQQALLALTPDRLYAFEAKVKGRAGFQVKKEAAVWERAGLRVSSEQKMGLTNMTIESPAEGERATMVPIGVKDDAVNVEFIRLMQESHPAVEGAAG